MTYFCLIQSRTLASHLEALDADTPLAAVQEARQILNQHRSAATAEVFSARETIAVLHPAAQPSSGVCIGSQSPAPDTMA